MSWPCHACADFMFLYFIQLSYHHYVSSLLWMSICFTLPCYAGFNLYRTVCICHITWINVMTLSLLSYLNMLILFTFVNISFLTVVVPILVIRSKNVHTNPGPIMVKKSHQLNICHSNIRSLSRAKLLAVKTSLSNAFDIITLSEPLYCKCH